MSPVLPHIANECLAKFKADKEIKWPKVDQKYIVAEKNEIVIQINGKKRNTILMENDVAEKIILKNIEEKKLITKYIKGKKIIKTIFVKNRLINYIIE